MFISCCYCWGGGGGRWNKVKRCGEKEKKKGFEGRKIYLL